MKERCLAALLIVLLLSGCGSGSAKETVPSAGLEQAETVEADGAMTAEQTEKEPAL